jgi:hypothetical protein
MQYPVESARLGARHPEKRQQTRERKPATLVTRLDHRPPAFTYGLFLRQVDAQLRPVLGDDEIRAAAVVFSGPAPYPLIWLTTAGGAALAWLLRTVGSFGALMHSHGFWVYELVVMMPVVCAALPGLLLQKSMLVAVTDAQFLAARWSIRRREASRKASRVSLMPANITVITTRRQLWTTTIVLNGPGTGPIRLHAIKGHRAELESVLAAAQAARALVGA